MLDINKIYTSKNYGDFKVVEYINCSDVLIEFIDTGYQAKAKTSSIYTGRVKDKLKPSVYGVGFIGDGKHKSTIKGEVSKKYTCWNNMLERCYCPCANIKQPTYFGCTVIEDWLNFQVFAAWYDNNYPDDGGGYQIDKDIKVKGNKIYSPDTCLFVSQADNVIEASAKNYRLISPAGDVVDIYNLSKFARDNDLNQGDLHAVISGKLNNHKQWTLNN